MKDSAQKKAQETLDGKDPFEDKAGGAKGGEKPFKLVLKGEQLAALKPHVDAYLAAREEGRKYHQEMVAKIASMQEAAHDELWARVYEARPELRDKDVRFNLEHYEDGVIVVEDSNCGCGGDLSDLLAWLASGG